MRWLGLIALVPAALLGQGITRPAVGIGHGPGLNTKLSCSLEGGPHCIPTGDITVTRASAAYCLDEGGKYQEVASNTGCYTPDGLSVWSAVTNEWTNSLDASAQTATGSAPTVTVDVASGPFSVVNGSAEADRIDDDTSNFEGIVSPDITSTAADYTASVFVKDETAGSVAIQVVPSAGTTQRCDVTAFPSPSSAASIGSPTCHAPVDVGDGWWRIAITGTGEATGTIRGTFLIGTTASVTGSVLVSALQFEQASFAGRPCLAGGVSTTCSSDSIEASTSNLVASASYCVTLEFTPDVSGLAVDRRLFDSRASGTNGPVLDVDSSLRLALTVGNSTTTATARTAALTWNVGTTYFIEGCWNPSTIMVRRLNDGSIATSDAVAMPTNLSDNSGLCVFNGGADIVHCRGNISGVRVTRQ